MLKNIKQPRMIFIGGSNVAFGFDSNLIEDSLKINVINNGLHAGVGLKFMLDDIQDYATKGDIIILSPEYYHLYEPLDNGVGSPLSDIIFAVDNSKFNYLSYKQKINLINNIPQYSKALILSFIKDILAPNHQMIYTLDAFNDKGDVVKHWGQGKQEFLNKEIGSKGINEETLSYLKASVRSLNEKGCHVYLLPSALASSSYQLSKSNIEILTKRLNDGDIGYISSPRKSAFHDSLFFDTPSHLGQKGAIKRSLEFISDFKKNHH